MQNTSVQLVHTYREANKLADFIANHVFFFVEMNSIQYSTLHSILQELPRKAKTIFLMDKRQTPNLRIRKFQNGNFIVRERIAQQL